MIGVGLCTQITNRLREGALNINAVQLDGSSKYILFDSTGSNLAIANRTTYSFSFWFYYTDAPGGFVHLFSMWDATLGRYFRILLAANELVYFDNYGTNNSADFLRKYSTEFTIPNQWNHVVITYNDGLPNADKQQIYINGALCTTTLSEGSYSGGSYAGAGGSMSLGASAAGAAFANIMVASYAGFSNVLSGANVTTLFNGGRYYSHSGNVNCFLALDYSTRTTSSAGEIVNRTYIGNSLATGENTVIADGQLT